MSIMFLQNLISAILKGGISRSCSLAYICTQNDKVDNKPRDYRRLPYWSCSISFAFFSVFGSGKCTCSVCKKFTTTSFSADRHFRAEEKDPEKRKTQEEILKLLKENKTPDNVREDVVEHRSNCHPNLPRGVVSLQSVHFPFTRPNWVRPRKKPKQSHHNRCLC